MAKGKVKARELVDVHMNFLSVVTEGANGETFKIFKRAPSAEEREEAKKGTNAVIAAKEGEEQMTPEQMAALEKVTKANEVLTGENEALKAQVTKAVEAVVAAQKTIVELAARIESIEKEFEEEAEPTPEVPAAPVAEDVMKTLAALTEQVAKLSGQKREPAGKGTTEEKPEGTQKGLFSGFFYGRQ